MKKRLLISALIAALLSSSMANAAEQPRLVDVGLVVATSAMVVAGSPVIALIGTAGLMSESMIFFSWIRQPSAPQK